jgi:hypothetical protein
MRRPRLSPRTLKWMLRLYPPLLGAGIRVRRVSADLREIDVDMKQHWWNMNYVGTHYGGSLYSMTDPFYMLMLLHNLGRDYVVWDKAANIRFRKPGTGRVRAEFRLTAQQLEEFRARLETQEKLEPVMIVQVLDEQDEVVAEVEKQLYLRRKQRSGGSAVP